MGQGDVPGLAKKSRPEQKKTCRHCQEEEETEPKSPYGGLKVFVCVCVYDSVCVLVFLHIQAWNNVEQQQFVLKPADPP